MMPSVTTNRKQSFASCESWSHYEESSGKYWPVLAAGHVEEGAKNESIVGMGTSKGYGIFSLTKPWNAAWRKDGENGRLHKTLSSASCLESVRNSGTADGYRFL